VMYALKLVPFNMSSSLDAEIENPHIIFIIVFKILEPIIPVSSNLCVAISTVETVTSYFLSSREDID
jgi:hypothetical protein